MSIMTSIPNPKDIDETPRQLKMVNSEEPLNPHSKTHPPPYERQVSHAAEIKFINDHYVTRALQYQFQLSLAEGVLQVHKGPVAVQKKGLHV